MAISLTKNDVIAYKPFLEKLAGIDKRPERLDSYINAGINNVKNDLIYLNIDFNDVTLNNDNLIFKNLILQNIYYSYLESLNIVNITSENLELSKIEYKKYLEMLDKFRIDFNNSKVINTEDKKPYYNNITLSFY